MKTYEVELKRVSYIVVTVEADSEEDAEGKAYECIEMYPDSCADWNMEYVKEIKGEEA